MTAALWNTIIDAIWQTLEMTFVSGLFAYIGGLPLGIILSVTQTGGVVENKWVNQILGFIVNVGRSIPFLILLVLLIPVTRFITGSSIGTHATIVPLTVGAVPIVARMVESSLNEVDRGIIEAARSMGASSLQTILLFIIPESVPSLISGAAINLATILGYSAMAGVIGGGGLGAVALNYGYYRYQSDVLIVTVIILVVIVQVIQETGIKLSVLKRH